MPAVQHQLSMFVDAATVGEDVEGPAQLMRPHAAAEFASMSTFNAAEPWR